MQNEYEIKGNHFKDWVTRAGVGGLLFLQLASVYAMPALTNKLSVLCNTRWNIMRERERDK